MHEFMQQSCCTPSIHTSCPPTSVWCQDVYWNDIFDKPEVFPPAPHRHDNATEQEDGFMSKEDKYKLDNITGSQVQSDWSTTDDTDPSYIRNKPTITDPVQSNWTEVSTSSLAYIKNKPTIVDPVQSDWSETDASDLSYIQNKPTITPQVQADWTETDSSDLSYIQNKPWIIDQDPNAAGPYVRSNRQWTIWSMPTMLLYVFDAAGGTFSGGTRTKLAIAGETISMGASPTKSGYTFAQLTRDDDGTHPTLGSNITMPNTSLTVTAEWTEDTPTVMYSYDFIAGDDATVTGGTPDGVYTPGTSITLPTTIERTGYSITSIVRQDTNTTLGLGNTITMPNNNLNIVVSWASVPPTTHPYTIDANGGSATGGTAEGSYVPNYAIIAPTAGTRTGYVLVEFTDTYSGDIYPIGAVFAMPNRAMELQAVWAATHDYAIEAGTGPTTPTITGGSPAGIYATGAEITLPTAVDPDGGYEFVHWESSASGNPQYAAGATMIMPDEDVTVTAIWTIPAGQAYNLTYVDSTGATLSQVEVPAGNVVTVATPSGSLARDLTDSAWLVGWRSNIGNVRYWDDETFAMPSQDVTLTEIRSLADGTYIEFDIQHDDATVIPVTQALFYIGAAQDTTGNIFVQWREIGSTKNSGFMQRIALQPTHDVEFQDPNVEHVYHYDTIGEPVYAPNSTKSGWRISIINAGIDTTDINPASFRFGSYYFNTTLNELAPHILSSDVAHVKIYDFNGNFTSLYRAFAGLDRLEFDNPETFRLGTPLVTSMYQTFAWVGGYYDHKYSIDGSTTGILVWPQYLLANMSELLMMFETFFECRMMAIPPLFLAGCTKLQDLHSTWKRSYIGYRWAVYMLESTYNQGDGVRFAWNTYLDMTLNGTSFIPSNLLHSNKNVFRIQEIFNAPKIGDMSEGIYLSWDVNIIGTFGNGYWIKPVFVLQPEFFWNGKDVGNAASTIQNASYAFGKHTAIGVYKDVFRYAISSLTDISAIFYGCARIINNKFTQNCYGQGGWGGGYPTSDQPWYPLTSQCASTPLEVIGDSNVFPSIAYAFSAFEGWHSESEGLGDAHWVDTVGDELDALPAISHPGTANPGEYNNMEYAVGWEGMLYGVARDATNFDTSNDKDRAYTIGGINY
jgi:uncharacterized repeat protein (TIGR02543 family)